MNRKQYRSDQLNTPEVYPEHVSALPDAPIGTGRVPESYNRERERLINERKIPELATGRVSPNYLNQRQRLINQRKLANIPELQTFAKNIGNIDDSSIPKFIGSTLGTIAGFGRDVTVNKVNNAISGISQDVGDFAQSASNAYSGKKLKDRFLKNSSNMPNERPGLPSNLPPPNVQEQPRVFDAGNGQLGVNINGGTITASNQAIQNMLSGHGERNRYSQDYLNNLASQGKTFYDEYTGEKLVDNGRIVPNPYQSSIQQTLQPIQLGGPQSFQNSEFGQKYINETFPGGSIANAVPYINGDTTGLKNPPRLKYTAIPPKPPVQLSPQQLESGAKRVEQNAIDAAQGTKPITVDSVLEKTLKDIKYAENPDQAEMARENYRLLNKKTSEPDVSLKTKKILTDKGEVNVDYLIDKKGNRYDIETKLPFPSEAEVKTQFNKDVKKIMDKAKAQSANDDAVKKLIDDRINYYLKRFGYDFSNGQ